MIEPTEQPTRFRKTIAKLTELPHHVRPLLPYMHQAVKLALVVLRIHEALS